MWMGTPALEKPRLMTKELGPLIPLRLRETILDVTVRSAPRSLNVDGEQNSQDVQPLSDLECQATIMGR
jgi:hypothetical protein